MFAAETVSGPGRQLAAVAAALAGADVDVRVIQLWRQGRAEPPFIAYLRAHGVTCVPVADRGPMDRGLPARVRAVLDGWSAAGWEADLIQTHGYKASAVAWWLRRTGFALPWVGFFHGSTTESARAHVYHWLDHRFLGGADRVVVMSRRQARAFARLGDRVRVVYNAVVPLGASEPGAHDDLAALGALPRPRVAVVGRLSPEKGVDLFLRAVARLREEATSVHAVIAGDGPERASLEALARTLGIEERCTFLGTVDAMDRLYRAIDLLAIPSRSEGLPNVLLEALARDVPVVATEVGAIAEVLSDDRGGRVVPPRDVPALADALAAALRECRSPESSEARRRMADRFSLAERVERHRALYADVLASAAPARKTG